MCYFGASTLGAAVQGFAVEGLAKAGAVVAVAPPQCMGFNFSCHLESMPA